jgi:hypothetical protein
VKSHVDPARNVSLVTNGTNRATASRRVISATCAIHPGTPGFCNLEVRRDGDDLLLNPHVTGACQILLTKAQAAALHAAIGEMLG